MAIDIQTELQLLNQPDAVVVEARVTPATPHPLEWRLTVETAGKGGTSRIAQSGRTDGGSKGPVATVRVNNPGAAVLQIYEAGELVGEARREIPAP